ncbi:hypothetical protein ACSFB2_12890, partial [Glaesserella parasuis]
MTMTRERLAQLKPHAQSTFADHRMLVDAQEMESLLALAERALELQDVSAVIKECSDESFAELGRIAMRFVDRAGDVHPGIDDAERICREFYEAMSVAIDARFEGRSLEPQGQALPELPDAPLLGGDPDYGDEVYGFTA